WQGGAGTDTLTGPSVDTTWNLTGPNSGTVAGIAFAGMENLTGGTAVDTFRLQGAGSSGGTINGGGGLDVLDFGQLSSPVTVNLATGSATAVAKFTSIATILGTSSQDKLIGANANTTWSLTGPAAGSAGSVAFAGFEVLQGG